MANEMEAVLGFIKEDLGYDGDVGPDDDLLENGIVDSFNVVELALFVQEHFGIELQAEDVTRENFAKLSSIISLIDRRQVAV